MLSLEMVLLGSVATPIVGPRIFPARFRWYSVV